MKDALISKSKQAGFSTLELLIAVTIIITAISTVIIVIFSNQTVSLDNQLNDEALIKVNNLIEQAKSSASFDFGSLGNSSATDDIFKKELMITDVNPCKKTGIASISWSTDPKRHLQMEFQTIFTNPSEAIALGGDCGPDSPPQTGWQNIICKDSDGSPTWDFPQDSGIPATGIDIINRGSARYAVITSQGSASGKRDFWIVNVKDRATLAFPQSLVSALDLGSGFNGVDVAGNYAYVANNETSKQLQIIDITDLSVPDRIASVSLNTSAVGSEAQAVFYHDKKVYVGTNYITDPIREFQVFDVNNPASPFLIPGGTYNVNHNIYDIVVRDEVVGGSPKTLAYLAISDSVGDKPKFIILDVTVPSSITQLGSYIPVPNDALYGTSLYVLGNNAYLGRQRANGGVGDLIVLDVNNPNSPSLVDSALLGMGSNTDVRSIIVSGTLLFMSTSDNNKGFQVWNVENPKNISNIGICKYPQEPLDMDFDGNFIYVVNRSQNALRIIYDNANPFP